MISYIKQYLDDFKRYKGGVWCYEDNVLVFAAWKMYLKTGDRFYYDYAFHYFDSMIGEDGTIIGYQMTEYNIDNILGGATLIDVYQVTKTPKFWLACQKLYEQLKTHPRTDSGSFWHKKRYPYQIWMDGIYMGQIFLAKYSEMTNDANGKADVLHQLANMRQYLYDENRHLYVHAYDEKHTMQWANPIDGKSPNVWSRACGWVMMALVELAELWPNEPMIKALYQEMIAGLMPYQKEGMWSQIVDYPLIDGNYLETSGSAMIGFSIMKAVRLGIIPVSMSKEGLNVYDSIVKHYFHDGHLGGICRVAGLDNTRRNGSVAYYMSEEIAKDEVKGVAPFIALYSEII